MFPILFALLIMFVHAEDNNPASFVAKARESVARFDDYGVAFRVTPEGRVRARALPGNQPRRGDDTLIQRLGEHELPKLEFRNVLTLENRAFGTLADGRVVEIEFVLKRHRALGRYWVHRLTAGGIGVGGSLVGVGLAGGNGAMAVAGGVIATAASALPLAAPTLGFELGFDFGVSLVGGDHFFVVQDVVQGDGQVLDLIMARDRQEVSLSAYLKSCRRYLIEGSFERSIQ